MKLTVKEAIIFKASSAEEGVKGVHGLIPGDRLGPCTINVGGTLGGKVALFHLNQILVPQNSIGI